jgi:hypothetical protein
LLVELRGASARDIQRSVFGQESVHFGQTATPLEGVVVECRTIEGPSINPDAFIASFTISMTSGVASSLIANWVWRLLQRSHDTELRIDSDRVENDYDAILLIVERTQRDDELTDGR